MKTWEKLVPIQLHISYIYYTNENILVCAPTGACKTNVAMISILHEIRQMIGYSWVSILIFDCTALQRRCLHKDEFKIVYVAPMKALAAEVTSTFSHRLSPLNITVRELTGDMQLYKNELEETQMIVATPEKWDVITHKSSHMSLSICLNFAPGGVYTDNDTHCRPFSHSTELFRGCYTHIELQNERCYKKFVESLRKGYQAMFISSLKDNLNAEVARGTVTNVKEACEWLGYMYLFIRMRLNPLVYGIGWDEVVADPSLSLKQRVLIANAARALDKNEMLRRHMNETEVIDMVAHSSEIENIVVRDEEQNELETLVQSSCPLEVKGTPKKHGKISILIQLYRSCGSMDTFSLVSDAAYISHRWSHHIDQWASQPPPSLLLILSRDALPPPKNV
ncbi:hypothetical protein L3X38_019858 [Prunus dulcis]|uniref:Helicase ATP-binding domain-containing protein n=1 Tax=Prunus dulcis TaxID=3755 RepID=A0AAD4ZCE6_PRUDU|nr:hypothetical protein L3X38_019858 [Prunus dulcis]